MKDAAISTVTSSAISGGGAQVVTSDNYFERVPIHPDDRERVRRNREDHLAGRTPRLDHEFRGMHRFLANPFPKGPNAYLAAVEANIHKLRERHAVAA